MKRRDGFTLIELLTVMAIIGLLITILLPPFGRVLGYARRSVCMSNLKQLTSAVFAYVGDNENVLPPHRMDSEAAPRRWWGYDELGRASSTDSIPAAGDIWNYIGKSKVYRCPEIAQAWEFNSDDVGYGYNAWFLGRYVEGGEIGLPEGPEAPDLWCKFSYIRNASELIVFGDSAYRPGRGQYSGSYAMWYPQDGAHIDIRHGDTGCAAFFDGSARPFRDEEINPAQAPTAEQRPFIRYWDPCQGKWWRQARR